MAPSFARFTLRAALAVLGLWLVPGTPVHALFEQRELAAVSSKRGAELFLIDSDFSIKHYFRASRQAPFSGVEQLDGLGRDVAAVERPGGDFEVFVVGMDGDVWRNVQLGRARWQGFSLMGFHCKRIAAARTAAGRYELFVIGKDDVVYRSLRQGEDGAWSDWRSLGVRALQLAAAQDGEAVRVFIVGLDRAIWTSDSEHVAWTRLGGDMLDVAASRAPDGVLTMFATDRQGQVWQRRQVGRDFGLWQGLGGAAARVAAGAGPALFALGERVSELEPGAQRWRALDEKLPLELTFYGIATLQIPSVDVVQQRALQIGVRFSRDHKRVRVVSFPAFTTAGFDTPFGRSTTTVSLTTGGTGSFDPDTGRMALQVTLHFDQSLDVPLLEEDADVTLQLSTDGVRPLTQGPMFAEAGLSAEAQLQTRGLNPLAGKRCQVSIAGYFVAPASLLRSPVL